MVAWITLGFAALAALYSPLRGIHSRWRADRPHSLDFPADWLERAETSAGGYVGRGTAYLLNGSGELVVRIELEEAVIDKSLIKFLV